MHPISGLARGQLFLEHLIRFGRNGLPQVRKHAPITAHARRAFPAKRGNPRRGIRVVTQKGRRTLGASITMTISPALSIYRPYEYIYWSYLNPL